MKHAVRAIRAAFPLLVAPVRVHAQTPYQSDAGIAVNANASVVIANSVIGDGYVPGPKVIDFGIYIGFSRNVQIVNTVVSNVNTAGLCIDTIAAKVVIDESRFVKCRKSRYRNGCSERHDGDRKQFHVKHFQLPTSSTTSCD